MTKFELVHITSVEPREGRWVRLWFTDGAIKDVNLAPVLTRGVLEPIGTDRVLFEQVRVNPESGTIDWPGDIDLDPVVLYGTFEPASGVKLERRTVQAPAAA